MMMLPIGKNGSVQGLRLAQAGFSLIEVLLSVVILSAGLVLINQTLLQSLVAADYANTRARADRAANKRIWEVKSLVWTERARPPVKEDGVLLEDKDTFTYQINSTGVRGSQFLYEVRLSLKWLNSGREKGLTRAFYARLPNESK